LAASDLPRLQALRAEGQRRQLQQGHKAVARFGGEFQGRVLVNLNCASLITCSPLGNGGERQRSESCFTPLAVPISLLPSAVAIVVGILVLFGGGELFVAGATAVALLLGIPQIVIGLTVVAFGTSAPELFVSLISTLQGGDASAIAASNVVGSNIFNVLVVLGLSALIVPLRVKSRLVRRDLPLLLAVSMALWGMAAGGRLFWQAGLALLVGLVINLVWETRTAREHPE
jgi:cation:H+ antiporter